MIIVKTANGDTFINELRVPIVRHIKDQRVVNVIGKKTGLNLTISDVDNVYYMPTKRWLSKREGRDRYEEEDDE